MSDSTQLAKFEAGLAEMAASRDFGHASRRLFSRHLQRPGIYLANHSLGRPLDQTAHDLSEFSDLWYADMDAAWADWTQEMEQFCDRAGRLIGLPAGSVAFKTSAGQGLRAVLNAFETPRPLNVIATTGEFDSADVILRAYAESGRVNLTWAAPSNREQGLALFAAEDVTRLLTLEIDFVLISHVMYSTGQVFPHLNEVIAECHRHGAIVMLDLYHSYGAMPIDLLALGADFAVAGSYKYLRGGPGACWLAVHPRHLAPGSPTQLKTRDTGWFAKADTFGFARGDGWARKEGIGRWAEATPPIAAAYQARAGQLLTLAIGVDRLREQNLEAQQTLRTILKSTGVPLFEPACAEEFGAFTVLVRENSAQTVDFLGQVGIKVDARGKNLRICPDFLNTVTEFEHLAATLVSEKS